MIGDAFGPVSAAMAGQMLLMGAYGPGTSGGQIGCECPPKNGWQLNAKDPPNFVVPKTQWPIRNTLRQKDEEEGQWCLLLDQDSAIQSPQDLATNLNSRRKRKKRSSSTCTRSPPSGLGKVDAYSSLHVSTCH